MTLQALRDPVSDAVHGLARRVVPAARVVWVDGLAVLTGVVDPAVGVDFFGAHTHEWPTLQALHSSIIACDRAVTDKEFVVASMVHVHAYVELHNAACCVRPLWWLHAGHKVAAARPLVSIATDRTWRALAATIPTVRAEAVLRGADRVACRWFHEEAMTSCKRRRDKKRHTAPGHQHGAGRVAG